MLLSYLRAASRSALARLTIRFAKPFGFDPARSKAARKAAAVALIQKRWSAAHAADVDNKGDGVSEGSPTDEEVAALKELNTTALILSPKRARVAAEVPVAERGGCVLRLHAAAVCCCCVLLLRPAAVCCYCVLLLRAAAVCCCVLLRAAAGCCQLQPAAAARRAVLQLTASRSNLDGAARVQRLGARRARRARCLLRAARELAAPCRAPRRGPRTHGRQ